MFELFETSHVNDQIRSEASTKLIWSKLFVLLLSELSEIEFFVSAEMKPLSRVLSSCGVWR